MTSNIDRLARPDYSHISRRDLWSEILPGLWQGGTDDYDTVRDVRKGREDAFITPKDFDTVVTLYAWAQPVDWFVKEYRLGFWDAGTENMPVPEILEAAIMAHRDWANGKRVLIRCQAGLNRSGLIMALVLMIEGYTADEAIALIREKRNSWALCNDDFVEWLRSLDANSLVKMAA
mgnify:CR=1 FL=1